MNKDVDAQKASLLRAYGDDYVRTALDKFAENFDSLKLKNELQISYEFISVNWLTAACRSENKSSIEELKIEISEPCLNSLSCDIDFTNENEAIYLEWRFYWLIFHELGHWLYGHIPYYRKQGWLTKIGLSESTTQYNVGVGEDTDNASSQATVFATAHAAELQADAFATIELFKSIRKLAGDFDDAQEELFLDVQFCYYSIVTTICNFYKDAGTAKGGPFHPSWNVRCLNVLLTLFRAFANQRGLQGGSEVTYHVDVVAEAVSDFMEHAIVPTIEGIEGFAQALGVDHLIHDVAGLYDPLEFVRFLNGDFADSSLAAELSAYFGLIEELNAATSPLRSAEDFVPGDVTSNPERKSRNFKFQILTTFSRGECNSAINSWKRSNELFAVVWELLPYEGSLDAQSILEIEFETKSPILQRDAQDLVRLLFND